MGKSYKVNQNILITDGRFTGNIGQITRIEKKQGVKVFTVDVLQLDSLGNIVSRGNTIELLQQQITKIATKEPLKEVETVETEDESNTLEEDKQEVAEDEKSLKMAKNEDIPSTLEDLKHMNIEDKYRYIKSIMTYEDIKDLVTIAVEDVTNYATEIAKIKEKYGFMVD